MQKLPKIYVAIPLMDEMENIPRLINNIKHQNYKNFKVFFCVNQPENWWELPEKENICLNNLQSITLLEKITAFEKHIIDKSSKGSAWTGKKHGVGWARKLMMDQICLEADDQDIILSLDADTCFKQNYFHSIADNFANHPGHVALCVPYYHPLSTNETLNRSILRYEIYLRYYAINLWRIRSFYRFTAIGSAIALPVSSYKAIGGITPHKSGEDFYLIQKLRKFGQLLYWNKEKVYPSARYSDRVAFGTGPAMIKGKDGDWKSYPIFDHRIFDEIQTTQQSYSNLYEENVKTPMDNFLKYIFPGKEIWDPLRRNYKNRNQFIKACHYKIDALRIFQFLKYRQSTTGQDDEQYLRAFLLKYHSIDCPIKIESFSFEDSSIITLNQLRDFMLEIESVYLKSNNLRASH